MSDMDRRFDFHPATTAEKKGEHGTVREAFKAMAQFIEAKVPAGREQAVAMTKLEEGMFWANAGIARNSEEG